MLQIIIIISNTSDFPCYGSRCNIVGNTYFPCHGPPFHNVVSNANIPGNGSSCYHVVATDLLVTCTSNAVSNADFTSYGPWCNIVGNAYFPCHGLPFLLLGVIFFRVFLRCDFFFRKMIFLLISIPKQTLLVQYCWQAYHTIDHLFTMLLVM